jgi:hypothetical protein
MAVDVVVVPVKMAVAHAMTVTVMMMVPPAVMMVVVPAMMMMVVMSVADLLGHAVRNRGLRQQRRGGGGCESGAGNEGGGQYERPEHSMRPFVRSGVTCRGPCLL